MVTVCIEYDPPSPKIDKLRARLHQFNLAQMPQIAQLPGKDICVAAVDAEHDLIGGVNGEADLGWLYVDSLWVAEHAREQGLGTRLMTAIEQTALRQGMTRVYLMTTDFQALGFYQKLGYQVVGTHPDRPPGHAVYYLIKPQVLPAPVDRSLWIYSPPREDITSSVERQQVRSSPLPIVIQRLGVFLYTDEGQLGGGLYGALFWQWFDLRYLWVAEALRGQQYGAKLLHTLEDWLHQQQAYGICADTLDWQARGFFQQQGFEVTFTLPDRPPGHTAYFIQKRLR